MFAHALVGGFVRPLETFSSQFPIISDRRHCFILIDLESKQIWHYTIADHRHVDYELRRGKTFAATSRDAIKKPIPVFPKRSSGLIYINAKSPRVVNYPTLERHPIPRTPCRPA